MKMRVAVFGAGHVGCVSAACLARLGHRVWLVEVSPHKLKQLQAGRSPVGEPGLQQELGRHLRSGRILLAKGEQEAVAQSEMAMVCVGTPSLPDGLPDGHQVKKVLGEIAAALRRIPHPYTIVLRSTLGFPQIKSDLLPELREFFGNRFGREITFALNPEFLREGSAIEDFLKPPFVVVGTQHPSAARALQRLYEKIRAPFHVVSPGSASLLKYACNAFHAAKVVFGNEIGSLGALFEADPTEVMKIFCEDRTLNISAAYLKPGYAYGGSCLPKDLRALNRLALAQGIHCPLLQAVPQSNSLLIERAVQTIERLAPRRIALIGLSFKSDTDDLRESSLVDLAERLIGKGYEVKIFDPEIRLDRLHGQNLHYIEQHLKHLAQLLCSDMRSALQDANLVVVGKGLLAGRQAWRKIPADLPILDLTRQIQRQRRSATLLHLDGVGTRQVPVRRPAPSLVGA